MIQAALPLSCTARALALAVALCGAAQAQGSPELDTAMADSVRALVAPAVNLPADVARQARLAIEIGKLDPRLRLAPCRRIQPQLPTQGALWGRIRIGLRCVEGERAWQVWLPVTVKVFAPALVPVRALAAGTVLDAQHLQLAEVDWAEQAQSPFTRLADVAGRTLGRALQPGQGLRATDLRQRQWFAAGDTVQVLARGNGFAVSGEAQALNPGIEGQPVRVRTESGRVLTGTPVADRRVEVLL